MLIKLRGKFYAFVLRLKGYEEEYLEQLFMEIDLCVIKKSS